MMAVRPEQSNTLEPRVAMRREMGLKGWKVSQLLTRCLEVRLRSAAPAVAPASVAAS